MNIGGSLEFGITTAQALFAIAQMGRTLRGEPLLWCDWTWDE